VPLIDLPTFYPPKLPIGSGTSVGAALEHLMSEIDKNVIPTTPTRKGDWKPVIYFLTDGKPTDKYQAALKKWQEKYAKRCQMIVIGLGKYADLSALAAIADEAFVYNGEQEADFARFIQWMTLSVKSQSVAVEKIKIRLNAYRWKKPAVFWKNLILTIRFLIRIAWCLSGGVRNSKNLI
jgi:uncharacterized protein YegL